MDAPPPGSQLATETPCAPGHQPLDDGTCLPAGTQDNGCPAGELYDDGACRAAGIPAAACAPGFEPDGAGACLAILPARRCPAGSIAVPGDAVCREVAPCEPGRWGDIPVDGTSQFVDAAYAAGASDGSAAQPWTTIQQAVNAAAAGAIVAVAEGSYPESVAVIDKAVRLWGRCPALVEIVGQDPSDALWLQRADGAEIRGVALRAPRHGIVVRESLGVVLERLWIHDTGHVGLVAWGPGEIRVDGVLVDSATSGGATFASVSAEVEGTLIRNTQPRASDGFGGEGILAATASDVGTPAVLALRGSVIEDNLTAAVYLQEAEAVLEGSVLRGSLPQVKDGSLGAGLVVEELDALASEDTTRATLAGSVIEDNSYCGVVTLDADLVLDASVVRDARGVDGSSRSGFGVMVYTRGLVGARATLDMHSSVLQRNLEAALYVQSADANVEGSIIGGTRPSGESPLGVPYDVFEVFVRGGEEPADPSRLTLRASVIEREAEAALLLAGSEATIDGLWIRGDMPPASKLGGSGIAIQPDFITRAPSLAVVRGSILDQQLGVSFLVAGSEATIETTLIRDTRPQAFDQAYGRAVIAQPDPVTDEPSLFTMRWSAVERSYEAGVWIYGSDATIEASVVRDTQPEVVRNAFGHGIAVQQAGGRRATASITGSLVERSFEAGILGVDSDLTVTDSTVLDTLAGASDRLLGDGIALFALSSTATASITGTHIEASERAGVAAFGAAITMGSTSLICNEIDLDGEKTAIGYSFEDLGGNLCACETERPCKVLSASLAPPDPVDSFGP